MGSVIYIPKKDNPIFYPEYGALYNWYAAADGRNIAASGWHVPTITELETLADNIGAGGNYSTNSIGYKLKEIGTLYWILNPYGTNEENFNARGAAIRNGPTGNFSALKSEIRITSSTAIATSKWFFRLFYNTTYFEEAITSQKEGDSIRLLKDSTTLSDGETGTYTGNDGKVYRTICIGTQEWLADNLCETRFRNGDIIPWHGANPVDYFTNAEWKALTTAGVCAYDNTLSNVATGFIFPT